MSELREISFADRMTVVGFAGRMIDNGDDEGGFELLGAVRCCDECPECSHVLAFCGRREIRDDD